MGFRKNNKSLIDFSKMDSSIRSLLDVISNQYGLNSDKQKQKNTGNCIKKKLNVDLIRKLLMEAKRMQKQKK